MVESKTRALGAVGPGENEIEVEFSRRWVIDWKGHTIKEQFPWTKSFTAETKQGEK